MFSKEPFVFLETGSAIFKVNAQICRVKTPSSPRKKWQDWPYCVLWVTRNIQIHSVPFSGWFWARNLSHNKCPRMKASSGSRRWRRVRGASGHPFSPALALTLVGEPLCYFCTSSPDQSQHLLSLSPRTTQPDHFFMHSLLLNLPLIAPVWIYHLLFVKTQASRGPWGPGNSHPGLPWVSMDKFLPHTDHHKGVGTRCHLWPLSLIVLVPTPPLFSLNHPSSDTPVTSSEFRLLKVTLLDLTGPPFLVPWVTFVTNPPSGLTLCLSAQQLFWQDFCSHE